MKYEETTVRGVVAEEPKINGKLQLVIFKPNGMDANIQIRTTQFPVYHFGNEVEVTGLIKDPKTEGGQYGNLYRLQGIAGLMNFPSIKQKNVQQAGYLSFVRSKLISIRLEYEKMIAKILPEPQAGLLSGIILGSKTDIPNGILSALSRTGIIHIIALSGFNITIVAGFLTHLSKRYSRIFAFWLPVMGIIGFVLATGLSASIIRAAIMGILLLAAGINGRQSNAIISILFASLVMVFVSPLILTLDIGFQLSFAATCGLLILGPKLEGFFNFLGPRFSEILSTTIAVQIVTWPITSVYFGMVSIVAPFANLIVLPLIEYIMAMGFISATIGFFWLWLAQKLAFILWLLLTFVLRSAEILSALSYASINYKLKTKSLLIGYYFLVFDLYLILSRRANANKFKTER